jgi:hypothetical protein
MKIEMRKIDELIPYVNNARKNDHAVDAVASSIKNYGFKQPIVIDSQGEIIAGHTRLKAAKKLKLFEVPVIVADDLTPAQVKAYRIADNRVGELSEWDMDLLKLELADIEEFTGFENNFDEVFNENNNDEIGGYTSKIEIPKYEITEEKPFINELYNIEKTEVLIKEIKSMKLEKDLENFLIHSSYRFTIFQYNKIAEFYAHSSKDIQIIMEKLALVIIDFNKAIENGFVTFVNELFNNEELYNEEEENA